MKKKQEKSKQLAYAVIILSVAVFMLLLLLSVGWLFTFTTTITLEKITSLEILDIQVDDHSQKVLFTYTINDESMLKEELFSLDQNPKNVITNVMITDLKSSWKSNAALLTGGILFALIYVIIMIALVQFESKYWIPLKKLLDKQTK